MITINPNYLSWYQQIQKNTKDIEDLYGKINVVNIVDIDLSEDDASIPLSNTDISDTNKIGFLISKNGLLFKVVTIVDNEVYIKYICDLKGPQGEQGIQGARGPQGIQGPTGAEGPQGPAGIQGPQGIQGVQGIQGQKGDKGDNGNSFVVTGSAVSVQDLPDVSTQELGTAYYVGSTYPRPVYAVVMYEGAKVWQNQGTLQGPQGPQGVQGVQGEQGPQGATGPEGPQGPQGPAGEPGASINNMGGWIADNEYHPLDVVTYQGSSYICDVEITGSTTPPSDDPTHWSVLAQKGDTGATGPQGPEGAQGPSGANLLTKTFSTFEEASQFIIDNFEKILDIRFETSSIYLNAPDCLSIDFDTINNTAQYSHVDLSLDDQNIFNKIIFRPVKRLDSFVSIFGSITDIGVLNHGDIYTISVEGQFTGGDDYIIGNANIIDNDINGNIIHFKTGRISVDQDVFIYGSVNVRYFE